MADDLSLLFKLRADASGTKAAIAEVRQSIAQLRSSFGDDLSQMTAVSQSALGQITSNLNLFVSQRLPLVGGVFAGITEQVQQLGTASEKQSARVGKVADAINSISEATNKSSSEITKFLSAFVGIESGAKRVEAAMAFFGKDFSPTLLRSLGNAREEMVALASETEAASGEIIAALGLAGVAIAGIAVQLAVFVVAVKIAGDIAVSVGTRIGQIFLGLAKSAAEFRGRLFDLSQQTGISVETLSALEIVAKTTGSEIGSITASLGIFQRHLEEARDPVNKFSEKFKALGISTASTEGALRDTLKALAAMPDGFAQTALALELFGGSGKSLLAILKETQGDLDGTIRRFRELGILVSTEDAKAADEFNDQLALVQFQLRALLGREVIPGVLSALQEFSRTLKENRDVIQTVSTAIGALASLLGSIVTGNLRGLILGLRLLTEAFTLAKEAIILVRPELQLVTGLYERIAAALEKIRNFKIFPSADVSEAEPPEAVTNTITTAQSAAAKATPKAVEGIPSGRLGSLLEEQQLLADAESRAADEAKRLGEIRIKEIDRQFQIERVSAQERLRGVVLGEEEIRNAILRRTEAARDLAVTEAALVQGDPEKRKAAEAKIRALDAEAQKARDDFDQRVADARTRFFKQQEDAQRAHEKAQLEIFIEAGRNRIAELELQIQREEISRAQGAIEIEAIENESLRRRREAVENQLKATVDPDAQRALRDQLKALDNEQIGLERKQRERRAAAQREEEKRDIDAAKRGVALREAQREGELQRIEDAKDRQVIVESEAISRILEILRESHKDRIALIDQELNALTTSAERKRELDNEKAISEQKYTDEVKRLTEQRIRAHEREIAATGPGSQGVERPDLESIGQKIEKKVGPPPEAKERIDSLNDAFDRLGQTIAGVFGAGKEAGRQFADVIGVAFNGLAQGVGSLVQNYVLLGTTGPAALKKLLAATLAQVAAESAVKAIYWTAQGIVDLFFNPPRAAADFAAAALFASIAGASALTGRAVAGDSFKPQTTGSRGSGSGEGAGSGAQQSGPVRVAVPRNDGSLIAQQPQQVHVNLTIQHQLTPGIDSRIVRAVSDNIRNNGELRGVIVREKLA